MSVLIYSHTPLWEEHHVQSIEIALKLKKKKKKIFFLSCDSSLYTCPANFEHKSKICEKCLKQTNRTKNNILDPEIINLNLNLKIKKKKYFLQSINDVFKYKYDGHLIGNCALSSLISEKYFSYYVNFKKIKKEVYEQLDFATSLYDRAIEIIQKYNIKSVYVWNGRRSSDAPFLMAAQKLNISFYSYISGGRITDYSCYPTIGFHDLNFNKKFIEKLYKKSSKKKFLQDSKDFFDYMSGKIKKNYSYGLIQFSKDFKKINKFPEDKLKKNLVIFTSTMWEYYSLSKDFFYLGNKKIDHYQLLTRVINNEFIKNNFNIYVRWHPNLSTAGPEETFVIKKIIKNNNHVYHYDPESNANSYDLITFSNYVLTFGSTIGVEATYYGKPSILFGRSYYEDTNAVYVVKNLEELTNLLKTELIPKKKINAMKYGYWDKNRGNQKFENLYNDNNRWYFKNIRIKKINFIDLIKENSLFKLLAPKFIHLIKNIINHFLKKNENK
jgi:hypothetical protein